MRGDWITSGDRPEDIDNGDIVHLEAVVWIGDSIMQPSQEIADRRGSGWVRMVIELRIVLNAFYQDACS